MNQRALIAVAVSLLVAACSGGSGSNGGVKDTTADKGLPIVGKNLTYDPHTLVNKGEPITLKWWIWDGASKFQAFADAYKKIHPNVDIQIVNQPWDDYWTKLPLSLRDGSGPTVFNVHNSQHDNIIKYMEPYGVPVEQLEKDYVGVAAHVIDGKVYYIDFGLMTGLVYYNKALWKKAGLTDADIPQTWDQFTTVAKKLTVSDGGKITQAGFNYNGLFKEFSLGLPYQLGHNLMAADGRTPALDNPGMLAVIQRFRDFYDVHKVGSKDFGPDAAESFGQGRSAMVYNWGHFSGTVKQNYPNIEVGVFRTPVPVASTVPYAYDRYNGESTFGISAKASPQQKAVAQDFLRFYLTDASLMKDLVLNYSLFPMYVPLAEDPDVKANPVLQALGTVDRYIWPGPMPATFEKSIDTMWQDILYNRVDPKTALAKAQGSVAADLAKTNFTGVERLYRYYAPAS